MAKQANEVLHKEYISDWLISGKAYLKLILKDSGNGQL